MKLTEAQTKTLQALSPERKREELGRLLGPEWAWDGYYEGFFKGE